jgi:hypothetical protein
MKKNLINLSVIGLLLFTVSSCKKTYECHCEKKAGGADHIDIKNTKSKAESECKAKAEGSAVYSTCKLE